MSLSTGKSYLGVLHQVTEHKTVLASYRRSEQEKAKGKSGDPIEVTKSSSTLNIGSPPPPPLYGRDR